jgi:hypothetical protein
VTHENALSATAAPTRMAETGNLPAPLPRRRPRRCHIQVGTAIGPAPLPHNCGSRRDRQNRSGARCRRRRACFVQRRCLVYRAGFPVRSRSGAECTLRATGDYVVWR